MSTLMQWSRIVQPNVNAVVAPTIKNHSVSAISSEFLVCFGGYDGRRNHNGLLVYHTTESAWMRPTANGRMSVSGTPPPGRNGHSATVARDTDNDSNDCSIVLIGGWLGVGPYAASDTHILQVTWKDGLPQFAWLQPAVHGTPPGPCNMHSADYVDLHKSVYVFRGGNGEEYLNDLHAFDLDDWTWRVVDTVGARPQPRANHASAYADGQLVIFGGWNGTTRLNDVAILDVTTHTWTQPWVGGVLPQPRAGMTLVAVQDYWILWGGSGTSSKCFGDLHLLDRHEMVWLHVGWAKSCGHVEHNDQHRDAYFSMDQAAAASASAEYYDDPVVSAQVLLEHGGGHAQPMMDRQQQSANPNDEDSLPAVLLYGDGPSERAGHTATAVSNRFVYIFGGACGTDYLNDFYVLDTDPPPAVRITQPPSTALIAHRMGTFCKQAEFSDVTFSVQGQTVHAHRLVLSMVSEYFRVMFTRGFREANDNNQAIELQDCSYRSFASVLEYMYTGTWHVQDDDDESELVAVLELADRFFLDHLKQLCEQRLGQRVTLDDAPTLRTVALQTNASQLLRICDHVMRNQT